MLIFDQVSCVFILLLNVFLISTLARSESSHEACSLEETVNITDGLRDGDNIIHNNITYTKQYYNTYEQIYDAAGKKIVTTEAHERGCLCALGNCISFCKHSNFSDDYLNITTINGPLIVNLNDFHVLYGFTCLKPKIQFPVNNFDVEHLQNGSIRITFDDTLIMSSRDYCFDINDSQVEILICYSSEEEAVTIIAKSLYSIGMIISVILLTITILVYAIVPELRSIHGKNLMCYSVCLIIFYSTLSFVNGSKSFGIDIPNYLCPIFGYMIYFSGLATFFWLNALCYEIFSTISQSIIRTSTGLKRFLIYSAYGFGAPLIMTIFVILVDELHLFPEDFRPFIGVPRKSGAMECYLTDDNKKVKFIYFYSFAIVIIFVNTIFFVKTAIYIFNIRRTVTTVDQRRESFSTHRERLSLYFKLFLLMGICWSAEILSWYFKEFEWIFILPDILNCLQGFVIFTFFVCKKRTLRGLKQCYRRLRQRILNETSLPSPAISLSRTLTSRFSFPSRN